MEKILEKCFIFDFEKKKEGIREVKKELGKEEKGAPFLPIHFFFI